MNTLHRLPKILRTNIWFRIAGLVFMACIGISVAIAVSEQVKLKEQRILQAHRLKNIGLALHVFAMDNGKGTNSVVSMMSNELSTPGILIDPVSGKPFVIVEENLTPEAESYPSRILAYAPGIEARGGCCVLGDGSVQELSPARFRDLFKGPKQPKAATPTVR